MTLDLTPLPDFPEVTPGDRLSEYILSGMASARLVPSDGDILILAQKIVSKAEGRLVNLATIEPSPKAQFMAAEVEKDPRLVELVLRDSQEILRMRPGLIISVHRLGFICANAGIDHSNVASPAGAGRVSPDEEWVLTLPEDPDRSAAAIRRELEERSGVSLGVMIIDSHGRAWRRGTVGTAIGLAGVPGVIDLRGVPDRAGRLLQNTEVGAADELAAAGSLVMGQAAEGTPAVHARGFPYPRRESRLAEVLRPRREDLFR